MIVLDAGVVLAPALLEYEVCSALRRAVARAARALGATSVEGLG